jgi:hypothetical protein
VQDRPDQRQDQRQNQHQEHPLNNAQKQRIRDIEARGGNMTDDDKVYLRSAGFTDAEINAKAWRLYSFFVGK